jgi:hypothetical protein
VDMSFSTNGIIAQLKRKCKYFFQKSFSGGP